MIRMAMRPVFALNELATKIDKNIRFGTAVGLTRTAKGAQAEVIKALPRKFTIRSNWWQQSMKYGIRVKSAKRDDLSAEVRTQADWLEPHEKGGPKPKKTRGRFAIPTKFIRRVKSQKIPRIKKPRNLLRTFVINTGRGPVLFQRKGRGKRSRIEPVYVLANKVMLKRTSAFMDPIDRYVRANRGRHILEEIDKALRTMR